MWRLGCGWTVSYSLWSGLETHVLNRAECDWLCGSHFLGVNCSTKSGIKASGRENSSRPDSLFLSLRRMERWCTYVLVLIRTCFVFRAVKSLLLESLILKEITYFPDPVHIRHEYLLYDGATELRKHWILCHVHFNPRMSGGWMTFSLCTWLACVLGKP